MERGRYFRCLQARLRACLAQSISVRSWIFRLTLPAVQKMQMVSVMFGRSSENLGFLFWQRETTQISENCCHLRGRCEPMRTVGLRVAATQKPSDWRSEERRVGNECVSTGKSR